MVGRSKTTAPPPRVRLTDASVSIADGFIKRGPTEVVLLFNNGTVTK